MENMEEVQAAFKSVVDEAMEKNLPEIVGKEVAFQTSKIVETMKLQKALTGSDMSGLTDAKKLAFAETIKAMSFGQTVKANEALIEESDNRGGYLVATEVANAILRIAATVGLVANMATKWPMKTDELEVPAYTGSFLEGEYLGFDAAGSVTALTFAQAKLVAKKWQLAFAVGNDLVSDASVDVANWLLALAGEALANRLDKEGLNSPAGAFGGGILNNASVSVTTMAGGATGFSSVTLDYLGDLIASVEESVLEGSGFIMHRTVWNVVRKLKDTAGNYVVGYPTTTALTVDQAMGLKPVGYVWGYPVYTSRHMPALSATAISTKFIIFGNLKSIALGDKGEFRVAQYQSGSFGGKEIALADQTGLVYKHRHALAIPLPAAFAVLKTAAA